MIPFRFPRLSRLLCALGLALVSVLPGRAAARVSITDAGALADGATVNTPAIQGLIEKLASSGGGTVVVPKGVFVTGALDLRPGVHLHLEKDAVLRATNDMTHFPSRPTRIEGLFVNYTPALINAENCDGLRITGEGVLDGDGVAVWDEFWRLRRAAPDPRNFPNRSMSRARIAFISRSRDVLVEGVTFKDSQFWNLHLYNCRDVVVRAARFVVPDNYKQAPSTDGIDVDSSQDVLIESCHFSVTDDCIAMKGSKGPLALEDKDSPPVERVRVVDCTFRRGHAAFTLGSEATVVRDVSIENSRVPGSMFVLHIKLRPDTPQHYENIRLDGIALDSAGGRLIHMSPWKQYFDLQGHPPPQSIVRNITFANITGRYGDFGVIQGNPRQTEVRDITLSHVNLTLGSDRLSTRYVKNLRFENVVINHSPFPRPSTKISAASEPLRIVIVSDSTACNYAQDRPDRGWGMFLAESFQEGSVTVINHAKQGCSTKTFIKQGRWEKALSERPDFVLIQFGHNDSHGEGKPESTDAATDYRAYLRRYIDDTRAAGAVPILVTPMVRRNFLPNGKLDDILAPYAKAMKAVAAEKKTALIDLHTSSRAFFEPMVADKAQDFASNRTDRTHFNEKGARAMVDLIVKELPAADARLAAFLSPK